MPSVDARQYIEQKEKEEAQSGMTDEQKAAVRDSASTYAPGYNLGSVDSDKLYQESSNRPGQTVAERTAEQRANYWYGGYAGGAQDATATARGAINPYTQSLAGYGNAFADQSGVGAQMLQSGANSMATQAYGLQNVGNELMNYARQGPGPSVAQAQLDANTAQGMRQQLALAGSGRGAGGGASAFRQAAANQATMQGQANANAAMLQAQEAQNWRNSQLGAYGQASQAYGAAGGLFGQKAGLGSEYATSMGGLATNAQQGAGGLALGGEQLANQINTSALQGSMGYEQNLTDAYGISKGVPRGPAGPGTLDYMVAGAQAVGTVAALASDVRAKKEIVPADGAGLEMLENVDPYGYGYVDPGRHGEGRFYGPMAQDLEKSAVGRTVVKTGEDGTKVVDTPRLTLANTAAQAELQRELERTNARLDAATRVGPQARRPAPVDLDVAPRSEAVRTALHSFKSAPSEAEIASRREAIRSQHGSQAAGEFERYAMGLLSGRRATPRVEIGQAEQIRPQPRFEVQIGSPTDVRAGPVGGGVVPIEYSRDPNRLQFEAERYGTPAFGAPAPEQPPAEPSYLNSIFGPTVGEQVSDIAREEYNNQELRRMFRSPPRQDVYL